MAGNSASPKSAVAIDAGLCTDGVPYFALFRDEVGDQPPALSIDGDGMLVFDFAARGKHRLRLLGELAGTVRARGAVVALTPDLRAVRPDDKRQAFEMAPAFFEYPAGDIKETAHA